VSRRLRLLIGGVVAIIVATVLVAPVVLRGGSSSPCSQSLSYAGRTYTARTANPRQLVQALAVGVGVASGCGAQTSNVNIRTLVGVRPAAAVGVDGEGSSVFVRAGLCSDVATAALASCLKR
jgi:hypothetical protein